MKRLSWLKHKIPTPEELLANRWLRPLAPYLNHPGIWHFNRRSVARGVALGLFAGIVIPFAQTVFAALFAVSFRANLAVAAFCTFITNPFTTPMIYLGAYELGVALLGRENTDAIASSHAAARDWVERTVDWLVSASVPTALGLALLAIGSATIGYFAIHLVWRLRVARRWSVRRQARID